MKSSDWIAGRAWHRYEIENYLLVPNAIKRTLSPEPRDLFTALRCRRPSTI